MKWIDFLNSILTEEQVEELQHAMWSGKAIRVGGPQASTGKTVLKEALCELGYWAHEAYEVTELVLDKPVEVLRPNLVSELLLQRDEVESWVKSYEDDGSREVLSEVSTAELIKELSTREGVEKISVGPLRPYELKERYVRLRSTQGLRGEIAADTVLVFKNQNQLETK